MNDLRYIFFMTSFGSKENVEQAAIFFGQAYPQYHFIVRTPINFTSSVQVSIKSHYISATKNKHSFLKSFIK